VSQDVLGAGRTDGGPPHPASRRRRWGVVLAVLVLAGAGAYLAGGSNPAARTAPAPTASPAERTRVPTGPVTVVDLAVGATRSYALVGECMTTPPSLCTQELLVSSGDGTWRSTPARLPPPAGNGGFSARLLVTGDDDRVTVVEPDAGLVYQVDGSSYARIPLQGGDPVPVARPGGALEVVDGVVHVFDPASGRLHPLAGQPPVGQVRALDVTGDTLVAVGDHGGAVLAAVSTDRGAHWITAPVPGLRPGPDVLRLASGRGATYLLAGRETYPEVKNEFTELWRFAVRWKNVTPRSRPRSASSIVLPRGGLPLLTEESGGVWRLQPDGTLLRMPDAYADGVRVKPAYLVTGPSGLLLGRGVDAFGRSVVLSSADGANTWDVYVPG
jgi:hypothetical protein